jgi:hypothetical protein
MLELLLGDSRPAGDTVQDHMTPSVHNSHSEMVLPEYGSVGKKEHINKRMEVKAFKVTVLKLNFTVYTFNLKQKVDVDNPIQMKY